MVISKKHKSMIGDELVFLEKHYIIPGFWLGHQAVGFQSIALLLTLSAESTMISSPLG
jgi:hypothetical protein